MENSTDNLQSLSKDPQISNINYSPLPPQNPQVKPKSGMGKNIIVIFAFVLIIAVAAGVLYIYFLKTPKTYNATVYTPPKTAQVIPQSPTPTEALINKNDSSDNALNSDSNIINNDINNTGSDLNGVDQSFNDQQTNLQ